MIIGVTGGLASGKTTVAEYFSRFGFEVINADEIVHKLLDYKTRRQLRAVVIDNEKKFKKLERLVHPLVVRRIKQKIVLARKNNFNLVVDAPLLIEAGLDKDVDFLITVKTLRDIQMKRARQSLNLTSGDWRKLIKRQIPLKEKIKKSDFVINNNGNLEDTIKQIKKIWQIIKKGDK